MIKPLKELSLVSKNLKEAVEMVWHPYVQMKDYKSKTILMTEGEGIYLKDDSGKTYIDGVSSLWNVCLGHSNKEITKEIIEQMNQLQFFSLFGGYSNQPSIELALLISEITQNRYKHFFYTNSGSEAIDSAIKIVRQYFKNKKQDKRTKIISLMRSFHGTTYGAMSAGGLSPKRYEPYKPVLEGFVKIPPPYCYRCPYNKRHPECNLVCANKLEEIILEEGADTIAAFLAEPILGVGGLIVPPDDYFEKIKLICDKYGIKLIIDEISTGFGRLGTGLGIDHWKVEPDIFCGAKGISSGYSPLGVVGVSDEVFEAFYGDFNDEMIRLNHGFTTAGHPISCKAGVATLKFMKKENILEKVKQKGAFFKKQLEQLKEISIVKDIRGKGLMWGIELSDEFELAPLTFQIAKRKGLITFLTDPPNVIAIFPPFIATENELIRIREILQEAIELAEERVRMMEE